MISHNALWQYEILIQVKIIDDYRRLSLQHGASVNIPVPVSKHWLMISHNASWQYEILNQVEIREPILISQCLYRNIGLWYPIMHCGSMEFLSRLRSEMIIESYFHNTESVLISCWLPSYSVNLLPRMSINIWMSINICISLNRCDIEFLKLYYYSCDEFNITSALVKCSIY